MRDLITICLSAFCWGAVFANAGEPTVPEVHVALRKAAGFFHEQVSTRGGYLWAYSGDLKLREAEGRATLTQAWVQPPGTPAVGEAMLEAYTATRDEYYLKAARASARVLLNGQLATGGWFYSVTVSAGPGRQRKSTLDDDTAPAAVRFLMRLDKLTGFKNRALHAGAMESSPVTWRRRVSCYTRNAWDTARASPVAADGKLYFASESGEVVGVKAGENFKVLTRNPMGSTCMASPAISGGNLLFRTRNHLVAVGK